MLVTFDIKIRKIFKNALIFSILGIGRNLMKTAHEIAGGEKDIAVYLIANKNAIPFYEKLGMEKSTDVMQYDKTEWTKFMVE